MKKKVSVGFLIGAIVLAVLLTFNLTYVIVWHAFSGRINNLALRELTHSKLTEIGTYVDEFFIGRTDDQKTIDGICDGYVKSLSDLSSYYLNREEVQSRRTAQDNGYASIGIVSCYDERNAGIQILHMFEGSTAAQEGLVVLDTIVAVNGRSVASVGYENALDMLRGAEGTEVEVTVLREATGERFSLILRRGAVVTDPVFEYDMLDEEIGYIAIPNFVEGTARLFSEIYAKMHSEGMQKLILDLRFNPGGYMEEMTDIADLFLSEGETIYQERDYAGMRNPVYAHGSAEQIPLVVLMNRYTAGGAEFFAAALAENEHATLVGGRTAGMGYAQSSMELSDGAQLVLSTSEYLTARGNSLQGTGLAPDVEADLDIAAIYTILTQEDVQDAQLEVAKGLLQ